MVAPAVVPFLAGLVAGPVASRLMKPVIRGAIRTSIVIGMEIKKIAAQAGEELQDLAAEMSAEIAVAQETPTLREAKAKQQSDSPR